MTQKLPKNAISVTKGKTTNKTQVQARSTEAVTKHTISVTDDRNVSKTQVQTHTWHKTSQKIQFQSSGTECVRRQNFNHKYQNSSEIETKFDLFGIEYVRKHTISVTWHKTCQKIHFQSPGTECVRRQNFSHRAQKFQKAQVQAFGRKLIRRYNFSHLAHTVS
jgi:hypothetical protein